MIAMACQIPYQFGQPQGAPETVPLLRLIAQPGSYDGHEVWVAGIVRVEHESNALYIGREHFERRLWEYAVQLSFDRKALGVSSDELTRLNGRYAYIQGVFRASEQEHSIPGNGTIEEIVQIRTVDD